MLLTWVFALLLPCLAFSQSNSTVETLPGFPGELPFKLETGYVGVGEADEVQLFYYFIESERSPKDDPLLLWLTGGPGCSALSGLLYEIGPFTFDYANSNRGEPIMKGNPYSWTKVANIIFLDSPVGTGFSYAKSAEAYNVTDTIVAEQAYSFLRKWLVDHPAFLTNPLYISGDSYSGIIIPIIVQKIYEGIDSGHHPRLNIQGYVLGNPFTDEIKDLNSRIPFAHRVSFLSNDLYETTKAYCNGTYIDVDPNNTLCADNLQLARECLEKIFPNNILEPLCDALSPKPDPLKWNPDALVEDPHHLLTSLPGPWCRSYNYLYSYIWANDKRVQEALHVREGTKEKWLRCNRTLSYTYDVKNSFPYHKNLTEKRCRALIYSGDHDMVIPYVGTKGWVDLLSLPEIHGYEPWFVDGDVAGYSELYTNTNVYQLTFATVKGAGHTAPEYNPKQCLAMVSRWLSHFPL
ncbi:hypothetical protein NMG60_11019814 [Bertholletia excelsa]